MSNKLRKMRRVFRPDNEAKRKTPVTEYTSALWRFIHAASVLGIVDTTTPEAHALLKKNKIRRPRFVKGDLFYNRLSLKRVKGKQHVKN